jgi:hypothetical protein
MANLTLQELHDAYADGLLTDAEYRDRQRDLPDYAREIDDARRHDTGYPETKQERYRREYEP